MANSPYLLFDTSSSYCSVAFLKGQVTFVRTSDQPLSHAKQALVMIDEVLRESSVQLSELGGIGLTHGPGSFTGLRIGLSIAQGLAYGAGTPVIGVTSLAAMASQACGKDGIVIPALDARMNEVYWAAYRSDNHQISEITPPSIGTPQQFNEYIIEIIQQNQGVSITGCGDGWSVMGVDNSLDLTLIENGQTPSVRGLINLLSQKPPTFSSLEEYFSSLPITFQYSEDPSKLEPIYLRNDVSWEKRKRIRS